MDVRSIQRRLAELGHDPGPADGILGRKTQAAIAAFQSARKLDIKYPGTIGPKTLAALGIDEKGHAEPAWMGEARRYLGMHEVRDAKALNKALRLNAAEIPWCGSYTALIVTSSLPHEPLPANPLWARNWLEFGRSLDGPQIGAVVFSRGANAGHVGFVAGHAKTHLHVLGGNQSNKVSVVRIVKSRLLGYRWPVTAEIPTGELAHSNIAASVSTNEA